MIRPLLGFLLAFGLFSMVCAPKQSLRAQGLSCDDSEAVKMDLANLGGQSSLHGGIPIRRVKDVHDFMTLCDVTLKKRQFGCPPPKLPPFSDNTQMAVVSDGDGGLWLKLDPERRGDPIELKAHSAGAEHGGEINWLRGKELNDNGKANYIYVFLLDVLKFDSALKKFVVMKNFWVEYYESTCHPYDRPEDQGEFEDLTSRNQPRVFDESLRPKQAPVGSGNEPPPR